MIHTYFAQSDSPDLNLFEPTFHARHPRHLPSRQTIALSCKIRGGKKSENIKQIVLKHFAGVYRKLTFIFASFNFMSSLYSTKVFTYAYKTYLKPNWLIPFISHEFVNMGPR